MTDKTALRQLIEDCEAGCWHGDTTHIFEHSEHMNAYKAFDGSLDAAKALHEALLPGWEFEIKPSWPNKKLGYGVGVGNPVWRGTKEYENTCIARAWLIAILKAYEART